MTVSYTHLDVYKRQLVEHLEPADIAWLLGRLDEQSLVLAFRVLPKETAAAVFVEMESDEMCIRDRHKVRRFPALPVQIKSPADPYAPFRFPAQQHQYGHDRDS